MAQPAHTEKLKAYLEKMGILSCNDNPWLPSLSDIGCVWEDVTALIDTHTLFYCKAYRRRTVYLSNRAYFLLKACRTPGPMPEKAAALYRLFEEAGPIAMAEAKTLAHMQPEEFSRACAQLLENCRITAFQNGKILNPNWSAFIYSTAPAWEAAADVPDGIPGSSDEAREELKKLLLRSMPEKETERLLR